MIYEEGPRVTVTHVGRTWSYNIVLENLHVYSNSKSTNFNKRPTKNFHWMFAHPWVDRELRDLS